MPATTACDDRYRPEIDGLRAVAVFPVILFHAGVSGFSGGFVGVDIFFVISGYLITNQLIGDLQQGQFSLRKFYVRRARRILPALFFMIACCVPFAWIWMLPSQFKNFSESIIATVLFISNVFFWTDINYFSAAAEEKPLLHTWSLAVEEQFYIVFPLLLLLLWRLPHKQIVNVFVALLLLSLALAEWASYKAPIETSSLRQREHGNSWPGRCAQLCMFR